MNTEKFLQKSLPIFIAAFLINFILHFIIGIIRYGAFDFYWEGPLVFALSISILYAIFGDKKNEK